MEFVDSRRINPQEPWVFDIFISTFSTLLFVENPIRSPASFMKKWGIGEKKSIFIPVLNKKITLLLTNFKKLNVYVLRIEQIKCKKW